MVKQTKSKLSLKDRLKKSSVREETRTKDAEAPGGGSLPPGVSGIAKLTRLDFDVMQSGDYVGEQRLYAHGVCVKPKTFKDAEGNVYTTEGALVQLSKINLCDTTSRDGKETPFAENWAKAENRLKLLGIPTEDMEDDDLEEQVLDYVKSEEIYFRFRTWKPDDSDRVNVVLEGPATNFDPDEESGEDDGVDDGTDSAPIPAPKSQPKAKVEDKKPKKEEPKAAKPKSQPKQEKMEFEEEEEDPKSKPEPKAGKKPAPKKEEEPEQEPESGDAENIDPKTVKDLGKKADGGNEEAQVELTTMADSLSIDTADYGDWSDVAKAIIEQMSSDGSEEESSESDEGEEESVTFEKGDIVTYKGDECEVIGAFPQKGTLNLKNLSNNKILKSVPTQMVKVS